jgi:flagellar protein FlbD
MIQLTRMKGESLYLNSDLIEFVEETPDTLITLTNGDKLVVSEPAKEVVDRVMRFRKAILERTHDLSKPPEDATT